MLLRQTRLTGIKIYPNSTNLEGLGYDDHKFETNGEYNLIKALIQTGDIIFDVGASRGMWSKVVLSLVSPKRIYAFEPIPEAFTDLEHTLAFPNVTLTNCAILDKDGEKTFYWYSNNLTLAEMSSFYRRFSVEKQLNLHIVPLRVSTRSLDSFCESHSITQVDFLKIDTEGSELDVLRGATKLLTRRRITHLQFEQGATYVDAGITLRQVCQLLSGYGYVLFRIVPDGLIHIGEWFASLENYRYSNYLAVAPKSAGQWSVMKIEPETGQRTHER